MTGCCVCYDWSICTVDHVHLLAFFDSIKNAGLLEKIFVERLVGRKAAFCAFFLNISLARMPIVMDSILSKYACI